MAKSSALDPIAGCKIAAVVTISKLQCDSLECNSLESMKWPDCTIPEHEKRIAVIFKKGNGEISLLKVDRCCTVALNDVGRFLKKPWVQSVQKVPRKGATAQARGYPRVFEESGQFFSYFRGPYGQGYYDVSTYEGTGRDKDGRLFLLLKSGVRLPVGMDEKKLEFHRQEAAEALKKISRSWNDSLLQSEQCISRDKAKAADAFPDQPAEEKEMRGLEDDISSHSGKSDIMWKPPKSLIRGFWGKDALKEGHKKYGHAKESFLWKSKAANFESQASDLIVELLDVTVDE